jgi:proteasome lid subunit RPN8/RPN11
MSELIIPKQILDAMLAHCREAGPNEACGILGGKGREVSELYRTGNAENSPVSYLMDSKEQFRVLKDMREKGLSMVGIFHSHPASAAYPSPKDVSLAFYEDAAYVIVGLAGEEPDVKAFSIRQGEIIEIDIAVKGESPRT